MNPAFIALASSASWGSSDFLGGFTTRRISPYQTVALAHVFSLGCLLGSIFLLHEPAASHGTMAFGLVAGIFGGGGLVLFYYALSLGGMGLTAAIAGVLSAAVPVAYSLVTQGLPKIHQVIGFAVAIIAIWMIAAGTDSTAKTSMRNVWLGVVSGTCFGVYFVLLKEAAWSIRGGGPKPDALGNVLWSVAFSRAASSLLALLICLWMAFGKRSDAQRSSRLWSGTTLGLAAAVGLLDVGGNLLYSLAARLGRMDVAAVLSSLYPAVTILLAVWVLKERTGRQQALGMVLALAAVGLIAL